jgi:hypothetical protein
MVQVSKSTPEVAGSSFHPDEERWFLAAEPFRQPVRISQPPPPPPIGDPLADRWFR